MNKSLILRLLLLIMIMWVTFALYLYQYRPGWRTNNVDDLPLQRQQTTLFTFNNNDVKPHENPQSHINPPTPATPPTTPTSSPSTPPTPPPKPKPPKPAPSPANLVPKPSFHIKLEEPPVPSNCHHRSDRDYTKDPVVIIESGRRQFEDCPVGCLYLGRGQFQSARSHPSFD